MKTKVIGLIAIFSALVFLSAGFVSCKKDKTDDKSEGVITEGDKSVKIQKIKIQKDKGRWAAFIMFDEKDLMKSAQIKSNDLTLFVMLSALDDDNGKKIELDKLSSSRDKAWVVAFNGTETYYSGDPLNPALLVSGSYMIVKIDVSKKRVSIDAKLIIPDAEITTITIKYSGKFELEENIS